MYYSNHCTYIIDFFTYVLFSVWLVIRSLRTWMISARFFFDTRVEKYEGELQLHKLQWKIQDITQLFIKIIFRKTWFFYIALLACSVLGYVSSTWGIYRTVMGNIKYKLIYQVFLHSLWFLSIWITKGVAAHFINFNQLKYGKMQ